MKVKQYVIDTSVIMKYLTDKDSVAGVWILRALKDKQTQLLSSDLFHFEVANAIRYSPTSQQNMPKQIMAALSLPIKIVKISDKGFSKIAEIAKENDTTVYNASYYFLAISMDATFVTCDHDYFQRSKHLENVEYLG